MASKNYEKGLLKAIDDFCNASQTQSVKSYSKVVRYMTEQSEITSAIRDKFRKVFCGTEGITTIAAIDFLESLTRHCSAKVAELINHSEFLDSILELLQDEYIQSRLLNLLKYWTEWFETSDINLVLELVANICDFDIFLPETYTTSAGIPFDERDLMDKIEDEEETENIESKTPFQKVYHKVKKHSKEQTDYFQDPMNRASGSLATTIFDFRKTIDSLKTELISLDASEMARNQENQQYTKALQILETCQAQLEDEESTGERNNQRSAADSYRIVISQTEPSMPGDHKSKMSKFLNFKTRMCPRGAACNAAPDHHIHNLDTTFYQNLQCEYYHNDFDRRRKIELKANKTENYQKLRCPNSEGCHKGDACDASHNGIETTFHPQSFKTRPCHFQDECGGRQQYCPYYHSQKEKEDWKQAFAQGYEENITSVIPEEDSESDDFFNDTASNHQEQGEVGTYPPIKSSVNEQSHGMDRFWRPDISPFPADSSKYHSGKPSSFMKNQGRNHYEYDYDEEASTPIRKYEENDFQNGTLRCKLTVRKKYEDPNVLTSFFQKSKLLNGVPFLFTRVAKEHEESHLKN